MRMKKKLYIIGQINYASCVIAGENYYTSKMDNGPGLLF